jgi:hypothetical protein
MSTIWGVRFFVNSAVAQGKHGRPSGKPRGHTCDLTHSLCMHACLGILYNVWVNGARVIRPQLPTRERLDELHVRPFRSPLPSSLKSCCTATGFTALSADDRGSSMTAFVPVIGLILLAAIYALGIESGRRAAHANRRIKADIVLMRALAGGLRPDDLAAEGISHSAVHGDLRNEC